MSFLSALAPVAGALLGGLTSKKDNSSSQQTTQQIDPRMAALLYGDLKTERKLKPGVQPIYGPSTMTGAQDEFGNIIYAPGQLTNPESDYETITTGSPGLYSTAQGIYDQNMGQGYLGLTPTQIAATDWTLGANNAARDQRFFDVPLNMGSEIAKGAFDIDPKTGLQTARANQGVLDPTAQLQGLLSGNVDTTSLDALQRAAFNRANIGYQDQVADAGRMFSESIAPNIRGNAVAAGQYGGSRQGIAEGIAARGLNDQLTRNARDLGLANMDMGQELYGAAYRDAKDKQYNTATNLNNQAQQFAVQAAQQNLANRLGGANLIAQGYSGLMQSGNDAYNLASRYQQNAQNQQNFGWDQIGKLSGILQPGAGLGGTTTMTGTQPGQNPVAAGIGGGLLGYQLYNSYQQQQPQIKTYDGTLPGNSYGVLRPQ